MPGDGHRVGTGAGEVDRKLRRRLHGVTVEDDPAGMRDLGQRGDRLHGADFVVRPHDADQRHPRGVRVDGGTERRGPEHALAVHLEPARFGVLVLLQPVHRVEDRVMLDRRDQDPAPGRGRIAARPVEALHGEVVRLGAAAGEHHLARPGVEDLGDLLA